MKFDSDHIIARKQFFWQYHSSSFHLLLSLHLINVHPGIARIQSCQINDILLTDKVMVESSGSVCSFRQKQDLFLYWKFSCVVGYQKVWFQLPSLDMLPLGQMHENSAGITVQIRQRLCILICRFKESKTKLKQLSLIKTKIISDYLEELQSNFNQYFHINNNEVKGK